jgi:chaperonin GroEL (HSP60 family)
MAEAGVVDSFAVIRTILQDAVSLAGMLITTECLVVKDKSYERNLKSFFHFYSFTIEPLLR